MIFYVSQAITAARKLEMAPTKIREI